MQQPRSRTESQLSESVNRFLNMYAVGATAAGVSVLALAQPCDARIVYRHAHVVISPNSHFDLDLNHDGIGDFSIQNIYKSNTSYKIASVKALPVPSGNAVEGKVIYESGTWPLAFALRRGARIGPAEEFSGSLMAADSVNNFGGAKGYWWSRGSRVDGYLGLRFQVHGKVHYGWARLSVVNHYRDGVEKLTATLRGYAYETVPSKPIIAGRTKGPDVIALQPASLGHLATGASAIPAWRVK